MLVLDIFFLNKRMYFCRSQFHCKFNVARAENFLCMNHSRVMDVMAFAGSITSE